jgi:hypothetical protein
VFFLRLSYPSHFIPNLIHLLQLGRPSSHLAFRILWIDVSLGQHGRHSRELYLQVLHPVFVLGLLVLFFFSLWACSWRPVGCCWGLGFRTGIVFSSKQISLKRIFCIVAVQGIKPCFIRKEKYVGLSMMMRVVGCGTGLRFRGLVRFTPRVS